MGGRAKYLWGVCAVVLMWVVYSVLIEPFRISVNKVVIPDSALHGLFKGKKVVHISDLHITRIGRRERSLIKVLNHLRPDILFITGDFLTFGRDRKACIEVIRKILPPVYGIWGVFGNSDEYAEEGFEVDLRDFKERLQGSGVQILEDARREVSLGGGSHVYLAGVRGPRLSRAKLKELLRNRTRGMPVILLSHYPDVWEERTDARTINLEKIRDLGVSGWGWQDRAYYEYDKTGIVRFRDTGRHTLRVQRRESGVSIEEICLVRKADERTGSQRRAWEASDRNELEFCRGINPGSREMITIKARDVSSSRIFGSWRKVEDPSARFSPVLKDVSPTVVKNETPLLEPEDYFEVDFQAEGNVEYHLWLRMKAEDDSIASDSVYVQFDDSIDEEGEPVYRIGVPAARKEMASVNLILAGHTHGGQVRLPFIGSWDILPDHSIPFDQGLFQREGTKMYLNRGIGMTVLPIRFLCPPEVTVLEFAREGGMPSQ